jgi:hypothetical protein
MADESMTTTPSRRPEDRNRSTNAATCPAEFRPVAALCKSCFPYASQALFREACGARNAYAIGITFIPKAFAT